MPRNVGLTDRRGRLIVAAAALLVALWAGAGSVAGIVLLVVAALMLGTSISGSCPLYLPFRLSTCRRPVRRG
jgi:hypothetical protein